MSGSGLTSEAQLRYLLKWFEEFSELQREDFLPVLAAACSGDKPEQLAAALSALTYHDKPVSLFQCRIKLFNEWFPTWTEEQQNRFIKGVAELDADFAKKLEKELTAECHTNGQVNGTNDISPNDTDHEHDNVAEGSDQNEMDPANEQADIVERENIPLEIIAAS